MITTEDLYKNKNTYDYDTLKANIYVVSLLDILKTQKLTAKFCANYILNTNFQLLQEEHITIDMIIKYQPHILYIDLINELMSITNKNVKRHRIDSFEDFESYMNSHI